ncbi:hypothetical protein BC628DRAFT_1327609 [Trametes gibbosa]|nr:hypothetical protein BC628DRAFT_1327609 [Trametes gibbosa]
MGGNAFKALAGAFPRMPPAVYNALKAALLPPLRPLYTHVVVAHEAPEKADYGDLDIVVSGPREGLTADDVKAALRATHSVVLGGNRISNFAIPVGAFQTVARAWSGAAPVCGQEPSDVATASEAEVFIQVDVNVCADSAQLDRTVFYSSYGDMGLMLGLLVQTAGLSLGIYGLKLAEPIGSPPQTYYLSSSMVDILAFLGLSMERWQRGFTTQEEVIRWVASSPFATAFSARLKSGESKQLLPKEKGEGRAMRQKFISFLKTHEIDVPTDSIFALPRDREEKMHAALRYFGKDKEYASILEIERANERAKTILNGINVQDWTGVTGMPVRFVLDEVKVRLSARWAERDLCTVGTVVSEEVPSWQHALLETSDEEVRALVVAVKEELHAAGKLAFNWRAAKAAKLEKRRLQASAGQAEEHAVVVEA